MQPGEDIMIRLIIFIVFVITAYLSFRYVIRSFKEVSRRQGQGKASPDYRRSKTEEEYRQILGIDDDDSPENIRKKYKELIAKYHPDKVQHLGREFQEIAEKKTKEIMEAYDFFRKKY